MSTKLERLVTPIGETKWAHVQSPKPPHKDSPDRGAKYQIDVVFAPDDPEWKAWATDLMKAVRALPAQVDKRTKKPMERQNPIKKEYDEEDKETGRYYVTFRTSDKFRPGVFDKHGKIIPENVLVGNGSKVRVNYTPKAYEGFGGGMALYLNAVQVVELVEYKAQTAEAYGFDVEPAAEENSFNGDGGAAAPAEEAAGEPAAGQPAEDPNPFDGSGEPAEAPAAAPAKAATAARSKPRF